MQKFEHQPIKHKLYLSHILYNDVKQLIYSDVIEPRQWYSPLSYWFLRPTTVYRFGTTRPRTRH